MAIPSKSAISAAAAYLDSWLAFRQVHLQVPGVQAAVLVDGDPVLSTAHGLADIESGTALTPAHLFRIASHSKVFTATAVLQLVEAGLLRLDDPLSAHLSWVADKAPKLATVTIRELLAHSAGLCRDGADGDFWLLSKPFPDEEELRDAVGDDLAVLDPNERFKYSNIGYSLLGAVITAVSGKRYNDYVTGNIVARLGLTDTTPELDRARLGDYATGYTSTAYRQDRIPIDHVDTRAMSAATGFTSTARDVCRFAAAHFLGDTTLLSDASKRLLQHEEWKVERGEEGYGLGMTVDRIGGRRLVGHGGAYPGHATRTMIDPVDRIAISVLTNAIDGPAVELATGIVKLIDLIDPADEQRPDLSRFCGRFANVWEVLDVVALGGRLLALRPTRPDPAQSPIELAVETDDRLRITRADGYSAPGEHLTYDFDGDRVRSVKGIGGLTFLPFDEFSATVAAASRIGVTD